MASQIVFIVIILSISIFLEWQYSDSFIQNTEFEKNKDIQSLIGFSLSGFLSAAILPFLSKTTLNTGKLCKIKSFFLYMSNISYPFYLVHLQVLSLFISIYYKIDISNIYLKYLLFIFMVIISIKSVFGNFSFYSYKKACGQKKTVRGSKNSRRLSNGTPAI